MSVNQTLLIADGDAESCDVYRRFFTLLGYEVKTASDGMDCMTKVRQVSPAVLLRDLGLLWGGGDGVLAWLRGESPAPRIPVVLTATADYPLDMPGLKDPPVIGCLPKPFAPTALLESIRSAVGKGRRRKPWNLDRRARRSELLI